MQKTIIRFFQAEIAALLLSMNKGDFFMDHAGPFENVGFEEAKKLYADLLGKRRLLFYKIINLLVMNLHDADEIFQESMLLGWENRKQLRSEDGFVAWMIRIIRSVAAKRRDRDKKDRRIWSTLFQAVQDTLPIRTDVHNPEEQMISEEEKTVAMDAYERLPDTERIIYGLYHAEEYSQAEIGQMLDMPESTVRNHLHRAQGRLEKRMHSMILVFLSEQLHHDAPAVLVQQVLDKISASPLPVETTVAAAAAGAGVAEKAALAGFFTALAMPFLWIASLLISGTVSTTAFVRSMPTLQARRWLVKHLVIFYVGLVATLVVSVIGPVHAQTHYLDSNTLDRTLWILAGLLSILVALYIFHLNRKYSLFFRSDESGQIETCNEAVYYEKTRRFVRNGLWIAFCAICLFWIFFAYDLLAVMREATFVKVIITALLLSLFCLGVHLGVVKLFDYFVRISSDEATFQSTKYSDATDYQRIKTSLYREVVFVFPALCFFLGANLVHIIVKQARIHSSIIEILLYSILWIWVIHQNRLFPETRWARIFFMFVLQFFVFNGLRYFVY